MLAYQQHAKPRSSAHLDRQRLREDGGDGPAQAVPRDVQRLLEASLAVLQLDAWCCCQVLDKQRKFCSESSGQGGKA